MESCEARSGWRETCIACQAGTYESGGECLRCAKNFVSGAAAKNCTGCRPGTVSQSGVECTNCPPGSFRNASMLVCAPCPFGTYASAFGSFACEPCPAGKLCPVAASEPIDLALRSSSTLEEIAAPENAAATTFRRWLLGEAPAASSKSRRHLASSSAGKAGPLTSQDLVFGQNNVTVTQSTVVNEDEALQRVNRMFLFILAGVAGVALLVGLCIFAYLRLAPDSSPAARLARVRRIKRLHLFYRGAPRSAVAAPEPSANDVDVDHTEEDAPKPDPLKGRSVPGAYFTIVGVAGVAVAVMFVVVQAGVANYNIVQSLNPGTSPSATSIRGTFAVAATFRGYSGDCDENDANFNSSGFGGQQAIKVNKTSAASRVCTVAWSCTNCRITADDGAYLRLYLTYRLAMAVSISYAMKIPEYITVNGMVTPSADDAVFRGSRPLVVPVDLTPMHFMSEEDGSARYFAAVSSSDTEAGQRTLTDFALCQPERAMSECPDEMVSFGVNFRVYLLVDRKVRSTVLDTIANIMSLASAAFGAGGQALAAFLAVRALVWRRLAPEQGDCDP
eukprot:tig00020825_g14282.t1